jgi:hypothetical protein
VGWRGGLRRRNHLPGKRIRDEHFITFDEIAERKYEMSNTARIISGDVSCHHSQFSGVFGVDENAVSHLVEVGGSWVVLGSENQFVVLQGELAGLRVDVEE